MSVPTHNESVKILGIKFAFCLFVLVAVTCILTACFAYNVDCICGKDFPWYVDVAGAYLTNPVNVPAAVVFYIMDLSGYEFPIIKKDEDPHE